MKFQPTSNESLIKQTRNCMCDGCQFPPGQDVSLETRRLDTTELEVLPKSPWPMPREKLCLLHLSKRNNISSKTHRYLHQVIRSEPLLCVINPSLFSLLCSLAIAKGKKWRIRWYYKNISNLTRQKDKAVSVSKIILASQKLLLPLKLVSWSS